MVCCAVKVRRVFLNIKKAFDKVWYEEIIHKLKRNGISGNLLYVFTDFLRNRKQSVILHGQSSSFSNINPGNLQCSKLGPLLFLKYINDLSDIFDLQCNPKLFADDTSLFSTVKMPERTINNLNNDLREINK